MGQVDLRGFRHLARRSFWGTLWRQLNEDHAWGLAAELSYYFLLAFFPFLILLADIIVFTPLDVRLLTRILNEIGRFLPRLTQGEVEAVLSRIQEAPVFNWTVFLWMALALWAASLGINGMVGVLNRAYRVRENRPHWKVHLLAVGVTVGVSLFVVLSAFLLFFGDDLSQIALRALPWWPDSPGYRLFVLGYSILRWFLILSFFNLGMQIVYFFLPARRHPWKVVSPGSLFASVGWLLGSLAFRFFANRSPAYAILYGGLEGIIVLMIWFYLSSLFLVVGGEIDSEIYRMRRSRAKAA